VTFGIPRLDEMESVLGLADTAKVLTIAQTETRSSGWAALDRGDRRLRVGLRCQAAGIDLGRAHRAYAAERRQEAPDVIRLAIELVAEPESVLGLIDERVRLLTELRTQLSQPAPRPADAGSAA
jgi:hypothetical protein